MTALWDHCEQWKLRLLNDGVLVDEVMCDGPAPAIGAKVYLSERKYDAVGHPDHPCRVRKTTAIVTAQDVSIYDQNSYLLVIARVESRGVLPAREVEK